MEAKQGGCTVGKRLWAAHVSSKGHLRCLGSCSEVPTVRGAIWSGAWYDAASCVCVCVCVPAVCRCGAAVCCFCFLVHRSSLFLNRAQW